MGVIREEVFMMVGWGGRDTMEGGNPERESVCVCVCVCVHVCTRWNKVGQ